MARSSAPSAPIWKSSGPPSTHGLPIFTSGSTSGSTSAMLQPLRHNHLAVDVNTVNLKHRLRQIETDERRGHRTISLMKNVLSVMWHCRDGNGGRPSHHA